MLRTTAFACAALLANTLVAQSATVTLFDDTFDADSAGVVGFVPTTDLTNWTVTEGNVDILGTGFDCTGCIDLDGTDSSGPAKLQTKQSLSFLAGIVYSFSLYFAAGTEEEEITLSLNEGLSTTFSAGTTESIFQVDNSGGTFSSPVFLSLSGPVNDFGPYLDRVLITYETAAIPLPATAPLLLVALGGFGLVARRRRAL